MKLRNFISKNSETCLFLLDNYNGINKQLMKNKSRNEGIIFIANNKNNSKKQA